MPKKPLEICSVTLTSRHRLGDFTGDPPPDARYQIGYVRLDTAAKTLTATNQLLWVVMPVAVTGSLSSPVFLSGDWLSEHCPEDGDLVIRFFNNGTAYCGPKFDKPVPFRPGLEFPVMRPREHDTAIVASPTSLRRLADLADQLEVEEVSLSLSLGPGDPVDGYSVTKEPVAFSMQDRAAGLVALCDGGDWIATAASLRQAERLICGAPPAEPDGEVQPVAESARPTLPTTKGEAVARLKSLGVKLLPNLPPIYGHEMTVAQITEAEAILATGLLNVKQIDKPKAPALAQQYADAKAKCGDALLLFRVGDFYELFGDDAQVAANTLGLTLTSRDKGPDSVAMAGFPYHQLESCLVKLVASGHRAAVCEMVDDPAKPSGREITRMISPPAADKESVAVKPEPESAKKPKAKAAPKPKVAKSVAPSDPKLIAKLRSAAGRGDLAVIAALLDAGVSVDATDRNGYTALCLAAVKGQTEACRLLLDRGATVDHLPTSRITALASAALCGHLEVCRLLCERGADPLLKDTAEWTSVERAEYRGHAAVAKLLKSFVKKGGK